MQPRADAPIFLVGFMASGKTTVGKLVASRIGWAFADIDDLVTRAAGLSVTEIFAAEGEEGFRRRERDAIRDAAARTRSVIATGGGAVCAEENLGLMLSAGRVVALAVSAEEAVARAGAQSGRPLLDGQTDPLGTARSLLGARAQLYARAHLRVETEGRTSNEIAGEILASLGLDAAGGRV
ncbi:MAG TPA: shikimate kinase [Polyangia bacterium]|nr:shikimate kinase [Polyangia bacterium]